MSDDWKVGDLAVCVDASRRDLTHPVNLYNLSLLSEGAIYRVAAVREDCLRLCDLPFDYWLDDFIDGYLADRFRKIRPDEPEACEEEFQILLKLSKKRVAA